MRISDWSSDVCSSDLDDPRLACPRADPYAAHDRPDRRIWTRLHLRPVSRRPADGRQGEEWNADRDPLQDRSSVLVVESVSVRCSVGGRRSLTNITRSSRSKRLHYEPDDTLQA